MFIGHYAVALAAKRVAPRTSLGTLFAATSLADLLWPVFLLFGWEQAHVVPGPNPFLTLWLDSIPISHSLITLIGWGALFAYAVEVSKQGAPADERDQAVRDRDRIEPQRQERVRPRYDVRLLPPKEQKHRPEQIGEGRGGEQRAQRRSRGDAFRRQGHRVVPDEHDGALAARPQQRVVLLALAQ